MKNLFYSFSIIAALVFSGFVAVGGRSVGSHEQFMVAAAEPAPVVPPMPPPDSAPKPSPAPTPVVPPDPFIPQAPPPSVTMPVAVVVKVGRTVRIPISYIGDDFRWWTDHIDGIDVFREYEPPPLVKPGQKVDPYAPKNIILRVGGDPGVYNLHSVVAGVVDGKATLSTVSGTVITIGTPPPTPPGPGPQPFPPNPDNPLTAVFQAAYDSDPDPMKAVHTQTFASLFASLNTVVNDPKVTTTGVLSSVVASARQGLANRTPPNLPSGSILKVATAVGTEINKTLGNDVPLTADSRKTISAQFAQIADALKGVK